ncbi:MAG: tRNA (adenosine(37)-N6)-threonylcarbamoyltransferase complex transferase subunit TsaD, partial [Campylobacter sp.]|nr:tRNA (adenosine(37)-N6)-threonylcarbamoyltransferase complex transferase subunit TsaD [Campylobacter sp.]
MILAIESSCDDSSVAIMKASDFSLVHYEKISQEEEHAKYGGVVPELAARLHTAALPEVILRAKEHFKTLKAIAVTNEPGLSVSLLPGIVAAKALSAALNLPLISVNHLVGHIYSLFLKEQIKLPLGVLLVSGGHTMILGISKTGVISVLGATSDDSFGESFDKSAKMLGLGYPGGPQIQNLALKGDDRAYDFSLPLKGTKRLEYSFSGLKNQVRLACLELENSRIPYSVIPRLDRGISSENSKISSKNSRISNENSKIPSE